MSVPQLGDIVTLESSSGKVFNVRVERIEPTLLTDCGYFFHTRSEVFSILHTFESAPELGDNCWCSVSNGNKFYIKSILTYSSRQGAAI